MSPRLSLALDKGGVVLPDEGRIVVFHPRGDMDLSVLPKDRVQVVQPFKPDHDVFSAQGYDVVALPDGPYAAAVVCLPRAKPLARAMVQSAMVRTDGPIIIEGAKTDGVDSLHKELRKRTDVSAPISKAHGKVFWLTSVPDLVDDWMAQDTTLDGGYVTAPGVFSADGIDPASAFLAQHLPTHPGRQVADLGAGWGYLSRQLLADPKLEVLHVVEADHIALGCARRNLNDPRAQFHWADATSWSLGIRIDAVVMNPPFHTTRAADPALGQAFIATAARVLTPSGTLWMVANRHLPYEAKLAECFAQVDSIATDNRFKLLRGARPSRSTR